MSKCIIIKLKRQKIFFNIEKSQKIVIQYIKENSDSNDCYQKSHDQKRAQQHLKVMKEKNCQPRILYPVKIPFRNAGETKTFSDEEKEGEFINVRLALKGSFLG